MAAGLAAVFVTASRTPRHSFPVGATGYAPMPSPQGHLARLKVGKASCVFSWSNAGGIAVCTDPDAKSLPSHVTATAQRFLRARTGRGSLNCLQPMAQPLAGVNSYVIPCLGAGTRNASFSLKALKGRKGDPDAIAVNTFP